MGVWATRQSTLLRACGIAGDEVALAKELGTPLADTIEYLLGTQPVPTDVFLIAVDLVLAANKEQIAATRDLLEQMRRRHPRC